MAAQHDDVTKYMLGIQIALVLILIFQVNSISSKLGEGIPTTGSGNEGTQPAQPSAPTSGLTEANYVKWATSLKLDVGKWDACRKDPATKQEIVKDFNDGSAAGIQGTPGFIINGKLVSGAQPYANFKTAIDAALAGGAASANMITLSDDDPVEGKADAPVVIVEWSDFQCPYCGKFFRETLPSIRKDYVDTGKAKLVYRDYPLSFHPNAEPAAIAANCAGKQGKFWEYHDLIFENQ